MLSATIKILINVLIYTQHSGSADDSVEGIKRLSGVGVLARIVGNNCGGILFSCP